MAEPLVEDHSGASCRRFKGAIFRLQRLDFAWGASGPARRIDGKTAGEAIGAPRAKAHQLARIAFLARRA